MNPILTSGLANIINSFTTQFETYFNSNFLTLLSSEVGSYYGVLGAGLMFFLIVNGALFALREKTGKDLQAEIMRCVDRKSTRLNSSHWNKSRMPSSA